MREGRTEDDEEHREWGTQIGGTEGEEDTYTNKEGEPLGKSINGTECSARETQ